MTRASLLSPVVTDACAAVSAAAGGFEARWTLRALRRVDPDLHDLLLGQVRDLEAALVTGSEDDVAEQAAATVRGWRAAAERMAAVGAPDDAYLFGQDARSGLRVAIGDCRGSRERAAELPLATDHDGHKWLAPVVFVTPDEVATLLAAQQELLKIKGAFVGCELLELYPDEPKVDAT